MGPLIAHMLEEQFRRLRLGDRFFYAHAMQPALVRMLEHQTTMQVVVRRHVHWEADAAATQRSGPRQGCSAFLACDEQA